MICLGEIILHACAFHNYSYWTVLAAIIKAMSCVANNSQELAVQDVCDNIEKCSALVMSI